MALRLALVGAGRMGRTHARALAPSRAVTLAAVVEPSDAAAGLLAAAVPRRCGVDELLRSGGFDAALVAVPTRLHLEVVAALLEAGVPVLCEKPCGLRSGEARELGALAARAGVPLRVAYWRRFVPELVALRRRIAAGELGAVSFLLCAQWDERPPAAAFRDPAASGGILVDMGVHEFDLARWLTGLEVVRACGFASDVCSEPPVEGDPESVAVAALLSSGATMLVTLGRRHAPGEVHRAEAIGTAGAVRADFVQPPTGEATILAALRAQAEDFAALVGGAQGASATPADAVAALEAAELVRAALRAPRPE